jgi:GNAT superfamily N-acetyltransferase
MPDLLVKLYELPALEPVLTGLRDRNVDIRRALTPEKHLVTQWVEQKFSAHWASECEAAFARQPVSCFIAVHDGQCIGFACSEATGRGFFGPTAVEGAFRGLGIGKGLLLACLHDLADQGYAYGIIGAAGPVDFYARTVGATVIEGSSPGIYRGMLKGPKAKI